MPTQPAKDFNRILTEEVLVPMLAVADFDERRTIFREQIHCAFEPAFLPTMLHVLWALREILPKQESDAAPQILAAIMFELRDFLAPMPSTTLSAEAVAIELLTASIAADLGNLSHISDEDPFVALWRVIVRREAILAAEIEAVAAALASFALAAEARSDAENTIAHYLREQSEIWREIPEQVRLVQWLLRRAGSNSEEMAGKDFRQDAPVEPGDAFMMAVTLREALEAEGRSDDADRVRQLMFALLAESASRENQAPTPSDASGVRLPGDHYRREPTLVTADDLADYAEEGRQHELIGGELFSSPLLDGRAQDIISTLRATLSQFVEEQHLGTVYTAPLTIKLSELDVVKPALAFVNCQQQFSAGDELIEGIPDLIVEIKTDTTHEDALGAKTNLYGRAGVPEFWLIIETKWHKAMQAYGREHGQWVLFGRDPIIRSRSVPGLVVHLTDILKQGQLSKPIETPESAAESSASSPPVDGDSHPADVLTVQSWLQRHEAWDEARYLADVDRSSALVAILRLLEAPHRMAVATAVVELVRHGPGIVKPLLTAFAVAGRDEEANDLWFILSELGEDAEETLAKIISSSHEEDFRDTLRLMGCSEDLANKIVGRRRHLARKGLSLVSA